MVHSDPARSTAPYRAPARWVGLARAVGRLLGSLNQNWLTRTGLVLTLLFVMVAIFGPIFAGDPLKLSFDRLAAPSLQHPFGTDHVGRDLLARVLAGARISLSVSLASVVGGLTLALPLGMTAGYFATTWVDEIIMRTVDVILALPLFLLGLVVIGMTGHASTQIGPVEVSPAAKIVVLIAIASIPMFTRVARAATLVERSEDYVGALRILGVSRVTIIGSEILVNVLQPVLVQAFFWMAIAVFAEAALSFLGLGIQPPQPTLGNLLYDARGYILYGAWWYSVFPGLMLSFAIVSLNLLGDGLSDLLDPQLR